MGSWDFVDKFGPPTLPLLIVSNTQLIGYIAIQTMPSLNNLVTPTMIGTQYMPISTPFVSSPRPLTIAPNSIISMGPFSNPFGWNPLLSSNPQAQIPGGNFPNMHIMVGGITIPPLPIRQVGLSLIDSNPPHGNYPVLVMCLWPTTWLARSLNSVPLFGCPLLNLNWVKGAIFISGEIKLISPSLTSHMDNHSICLLHHHKETVIQQTLCIFLEQYDGQTPGSFKSFVITLVKLGAPNTFPFLETLDIPYLYKLTNGPIYHNLHWPPILHKIPANIPKFEGK